MQKYLCLLVCFLSVSGAYTQATSGGIDGYVLMDGDAGNIFTISIIDTKTKTQHKTYTNKEGYYSFSQLSPSNSYLLFAMVHIHDTIFQQPVEVLLGETIRVNIRRYVKVNQLADITVEAASRIQRYNSSIRTTNDLSKQTPIAYGGLLAFFPTLQILNNGGFSIAQQNPRFNAMYIDGSLQNDAFGLSPTGLYGGQAGSFPLHAEEVEQVQVLSSSFDASLGSFTGGAINIITKAGSNTFKQRYFLEQGTGVAQQYRRGFQTSGPLKKKKVLFAITGEWNGHYLNEPTNFLNYVGDTRNETQHSSIQHTIDALYGYDIGTTNSTEKRNQFKLATRIDWMISQKHKLILNIRTQQYNRYSNSNNAERSIKYGNNGKNFSGQSMFATIESKSWWKNCSNRLLLTYQHNNDNTTSGNTPFPSLKILDGEGFLYAGNQMDAMINSIQQKQITLYDKWQFQYKKNTISLGAEVIHTWVNNFFQPNSYGTYFYYSIADFLQNKYPGGYERIMYLNNNPLRFQDNKINTFLQTNYRVNNNIQAAVGIRIGYQKSIVPVYSPRLAITYQHEKRRLWAQLGIGLFAGNIPLSWLSAPLLFNGYDNASFVASSTTVKKIRFASDPLQQWRPENFGDSSNVGVINKIQEVLHTPTVWKTVVALRKKWSEQLSMELETLLFKNQYEIGFRRGDLIEPTNRLSGADNRWVYPVTGTQHTGKDYILYNPIQASGYGYQLQTSIAYKAINSSFQLNYAYGDAFTIHDGNYTMMETQWRLNETINGRNQPMLARSDFSLGHVIQCAGHFKFGRKKTGISISIEYTLRSGNPFSFVYGKNSLTQDDPTSPGYDLMYVPTQNELASQLFIPMVYNGIYYSTDEQKKLLDYFIQQHPYLRSRVGNYAERNGSRYPFKHQINFTCNYAGSFRLYRNRFYINAFLALFNLQSIAGLLSNENYSGNIKLINFEGYVPNSYIPTFSFNPIHIQKNYYNRDLPFHPEMGWRFYLKTGISLSIY